MKLTEQQKLILFQVLFDTLRYNDLQQDFQFTYEYRKKIYDDILNQQDDPEKEDQSSL